MRVAFFDVSSGAPVRIYLGAAATVAEQVLPDPAYAACACRILDGTAFAFVISLLELPLLAVFDATPAILPALDPQ